MGTARAWLALSGVCPACKERVEKPMGRAGALFSGIIHHLTISEARALAVAKKSIKKAFFSLDYGLEPRP
jgi:hypothetical protein